MNRDLIGRRPDIAAILEMLPKVGGEEQYKLKNIDLPGVVLRGARLVDADLSGAGLYRADLSFADLTGADLSGANLVGANLNSIDASRINLSGSNLTKADLSNANLYSANLTGADLTDTDLTSALLSNARLGDVNLLETKSLLRTSIFQVRNLSSESQEYALKEGAFEMKDRHRERLENCVNLCEYKKVFKAGKVRRDPYLIRNFLNEIEKVVEGELDKAEQDETNIDNIINEENIRLSVKTFMREHEIK